MGEHDSENERQANEATISHNLQEMNSTMERMLAEESVGGNAGVYEEDGVRYPLAAAYGRVDDKAGEIIAFGDIPESLRSNGVSFYFIVASSAERGFFKITKFGVDAPVSQHAMAAIALSAERWNNSKK